MTPPPVVSALREAYVKHYPKILYFLVTAKDYDDYACYLETLPFLNVSFSKEGPPDLSFKGFPVHFVAEWASSLKPGQVVVESEL